MRIYCASSMTGHTGDELVARSKMIKKLARQYGVDALDPITKEHVRRSRHPLLPTKPASLARVWKIDKGMIRRAHAVIDFTGPDKSEGVSAELGYARYFLYKPVVRVWPGLGLSIARIEHDVIAGSAAEAFSAAVTYWGTPWKRLKWRLALIRRCLLKAVFHKAQVWWNDWR